MFARAQLKSTDVTADPYKLNSLVKPPFHPAAVQDAGMDV